MQSTHTSFLQEFKDLSLHRRIYLIGLFIMAIGLPLSSFLTSIAQFTLAINWLIERDFQNKLKRATSNKTVYIFFILPLVHILWLINTTDFSWALHDLKIKVPLLVIPLILGTIKPLTAKELRWVLALFVFGVFSGTTVSVAILTGIYPANTTDIRGISLFISHIRFSLMIVLSIIITGYYLVTLFKKLSRHSKTLLFLLITWFLIFLIILQSISGWVTLLLSLVYIYIVSYNKIKNSNLRIGILIILSLTVITIFGTISKIYYDFNFTKTFNLAELPNATPYGNKYLNDTSSIVKENGHYVNILISYKELSQTWPQLSKVPFKGYNTKGFPIRSTMVRYLSSKGLTKDRDGLLALDTKDIEFIENGYASYIYRSKFIPYTKIYSVLWELDRYFKTGNANNKSIAQRIEFNRTAIHIIKNNFWTGVGTGDLASEYKQAYIDINSNLKDTNRLRAHNQYITFFVAFGLFGFLLALTSMLYPGILNLNKDNILLSCFMIIIFISMLNEDTLETQAGVTFYIVFYSLFSLSKNNIND